jgi:hypothetical protein
MNKLKLFTELIIFVLIFLYMIYILYFVDKYSPHNKIIKKILSNKEILLLITIIVLLGAFKYFNGIFILPSQILSFVIPVTLVFIEL